MAASGRTALKENMRRPVRGVITRTWRPEGMARTAAAAADVGGCDVAATAAGIGAGGGVGDVRGASTAAATFSSTTTVRQGSGIGSEGPAHELVQSTRRAVASSHARLDLSKARRWWRGTRAACGATTFGGGAFSHKASSVTESGSSGAAQGRNRTTTRTLKSSFVAPNLASAAAIARVSPRAHFHPRTAGSSSCRATSRQDDQQHSSGGTATGASFDNMVHTHRHKTSKSEGV